MTEEPSPMSATARIKRTAPVPVELMTRVPRLSLYRAPTVAAEWDLALMVGGATLITLAAIWFATTRLRRSA